MTTMHSLPIMVRLAVVLGGMLLLLGGSPGCGDELDPNRVSRQSPGNPSVTTLPEPRAESVAAGPATDLGPELMIALAQAKNFHHKADIYAQEGDLLAATAAVREILAIPFPPGAAEGQDVEFDARARLAKLLMAQEALDEALGIVEEGIAARTRDSFFLANLHTVAGEVHEAMARALDDEGNSAGAEQERRAAIAAYDASIAINRALQQALMRGGQQ